MSTSERIVRDGIAVWTEKAIVREMQLVRNTLNNALRDKRYSDAEGLARRLDHMQDLLQRVRS
jgi:hypothetical protein